MTLVVPLTVKAIKFPLTSISLFSKYNIKELINKIIMQLTALIRKQSTSAKRVIMVALKVDKSECKQTIN